MVRRFNREAFLRHAVECDTRGDFPEMQEDLLCIDTAKWVRRADRVHISPGEIPLPEGCESHWVTAYDGDTFLRPGTLCRLQKMVEDREHEMKRRSREGHELGIKWFTAVAAAVAAAASLWNVFVKK